MKVAGKVKRLRELDFLRGLAIILVLLRHQILFQFAWTMGWIGVDLFFVLSGFLVSNLLFREFIKYGNLKPGRFLIRRGFKIYPIYYIFYIFYIIRIILKGDFNIVGFFSDLTFTQNYIWGYGYAYAASWSLAIEEHFYFGLAVCLWFGLKRGSITLEINNNKSGVSRFERIILITMAVCLFLRILNNLVFPQLVIKNVTMTHLRIDSLLAGVLISYLYCYRVDFLKMLFGKYRTLFCVTAISAVCWTPFIDHEHSFFVKTIGFTLLYLSFSITLTYFLLTENINRKLNLLLSSALVNTISTIGYCSYSIYIIHFLVNSVWHQTQLTFQIGNNYYINFIVTSALSITAGMLMTYYIEDYFLKIRNKYYPSRVV